MDIIPILLMMRWKLRVQLASNTQLVGERGCQESTTGHLGAKSMLLKTTLLESLQLLFFLSLFYGK